MKKLSSNDLFWTFIRSNFLQGSWNMERMQALGFCFGMVPIIKKLYEGEERKQAIKRHGAAAPCSPVRSSTASVKLLPKNSMTKSTGPPP